MKPSVHASEAAHAWGTLFAGPPAHAQSDAAPPKSRANTPDATEADEFRKSLETLTQRKSAPRTAPETPAQNKRNPPHPSSAQSKAHAAQINQSPPPTEAATPAPVPATASRLDSEAETLQPTEESATPAAATVPILGEALILDESTAPSTLVPSAPSSTWLLSSVPPVPQSPSPSQPPPHPLPLVPVEEASLPAAELTPPTRSAEPAPALGDTANQRPEAAPLTLTREATAQAGDVESSSMPSPEDQPWDKPAPGLAGPASKMQSAATLDVFEDGPGPVPSVSLESPLASESEVKTKGAARAPELDSEGQTPEGMPGNARGRATGMDGAKTTHLMGRTDEMRHDPPEALQTLPVQGRALPSLQSRPGPGQALQSGGWSKTFEFFPPIQMQASPMAGLGQPSGIVPGLGALDQPAGPNLNPDRFQTIETLQLRVLHAAQEIQSTRAQSISVIIRPDPRTELQLNLTMQNGQVEVEARVQRGDFHGLNTHWGQLQQSLSLQGIRLNALENSGPGQAPPQPGFAQPFSQQGHAHQDRTEPDEQEAGSNLDSLKPPKPGWVPSQSARRPGSRRDAWESWA